MPFQAPQWTDFLSCLICYNEFECTIRRPISLGCGHTICKSCLSKLQRKQCPFDQTFINTDINQLPENYALLQLVGGRIPEKPPVTSLVSEEDYKHYLGAKKCVEELALYLKSPSPGLANGLFQSCPLTRPMQRKLVTLVNCQLVEEEGRARGLRAARSLGERSVTELILQHQNPQQLSANLWAAVRARGCQFLGPAMQEEVLKLVLLALEDGSALSRKVLVMFVVQRLAPQFPQASKTSIGHVVQLLYRASCFKVSKREGDSSLMQLKDEFRTYEALRREHDAQVVQIATEAGLRIAPEQWSSLLYGDTAHKSHMQSIVDKLQTPQSFAQSVQELVISLQRSGDPGNLSVLRPYLELLAGIDPSPDAPLPSWEDLKHALEAAKIVVKGLVEFIQNFGNRRLQDDRLSLTAKYKTSMCRDLVQRRNCPRGLNCTFAHSQEELDRFRARSKRNGGNGQAAGSSTRSPNPDDLSYELDDDDFVNVCDSSPISFNSYINSNTPLTSPACEMPSYVYDGSYISEATSSEKEATLAISSPTTQLFSAQVSNRCSLTSSTSHPDAYPSLQTSHKLNPESPAFQPLAAKTPQAQCMQSSYQTLPNTTAIIPSAITGLSTTKVKLFKKSFSHPAVQNTSIPSTCDTSSVSCLQSVCHVNAAKAKDLSLSSKSVIKNQLECQTLAALQQRKKELLVELGKAKFPNSSCLTTVENGIVSSSDVKTDCVLKTVDDGNVASFYSPWSPASVFPYGSSIHCTSSNYSDSLNSSSEANSSVAEEEMGNGLLKMDFSNYTLFCPSEKDEFIPFDPPLVSKYGPISRCSKSLIREPAPIQVNAVSQMGELTSPTSSLRHPLPSACFAPSFYAADSVSVAIVTEQYLPIVKTGPVILPDATENYVSVLNESEILRISNAEATEGFEIAKECMEDGHFQLQMEELMQEKELNSQDLEEELLEIEKTIQEKEQNIIKDGARYIDHPYKQKFDLKAGGSVPTSIGPWPSQTLENLQFKSSEVLSGFQDK
ncbi:roquin-1 [Nephila pilipes]|uniref:RING-type E3 ubiquitin transferase n=1 Tax=Nephila pilipes TaxID=299642 RepID=A0A8X6IQ60_NEPPI|nr:roquin-1 [Nephila pilipes]